MILMQTLILVGLMKLWSWTEHHVFLWFEHFFLILWNRDTDTVEIRLFWRRLCFLISKPLAAIKLFELLTFISTWNADIFVDVFWKLYWFFHWFQLTFSMTVFHGAWLVFLHLANSFNSIACSKNSFFDIDVILKIKSLLLFWICLRGYLRGTFRKEPRFVSNSQNQ